MSALVAEVAERRQDYLAKRKSGAESDGVRYHRGPSIVDTMLNWSIGK